MKQNWIEWIAMRGAAIVFVMFLAIGVLFPRELSAAKKKEELPQPPTPVSADELESMRSRIIQRDQQSVLAALRSVLSIDTWQIEDFNADLGTIRALSLKTQERVSPENDWILKEDKKTQMELLTKPERREWRIRAWTRWFELNVMTEPWEGNSTRIRITILRMGLAPDVTRAKGSIVPFKASVNKTSAGGESVGKVLDDTNAYAELFEKLSRELAAREAIDRVE